MGFIPHLVVDPKHRTQTDPDDNLCSDPDPKRTTVFSACLGFPHLPLTQTRRETSLQRIVNHASCTLTDILDHSDETVRTVLRERERLRMQAVRDNHAYALDNETPHLTVDPVDQILLTCARAAERRHEEVTAEGVREVLSFKRTSLHEDLPFARDKITAEFLGERLNGKTCAPLLPKCEAHKQVLLYYIDNPDAPISDVVDATGVARGRFETFRLLLPDPQCYDREYIAGLDFDIDARVQSLHEWMTNSSHPVYTCSECDVWSYSKQGLAIHKSQSEDHSTPEVTPSEVPPDAPSPSAGTNEGGVSQITPGTDVETMLDVYADAKGDTDDAKSADSGQDTQDEGDTLAFAEPADSTSEPTADDGDDDELGDDTGPQPDSSEIPGTGSGDSNPTEPDASGALTGHDIVAQSDTPLDDIANALLMSQPEVIDHLLGTLDDDDRERLYNEFDVNATDADEGELFASLSHTNSVSTI